MILCLHLMKISSTRDSYRKDSSNNCQLGNKANVLL